MMHRLLRPTAGSALLLVAATACSSPKPEAEVAAAPLKVEGTAFTVRDSLVAGTFEASGVAEPLRQAMLSTKLMGTVVEVLVKEGDAVNSGQALVRIDARDIAAKEGQIAASIADAEAQQQAALTQANRMRALFADSAATRAQLDGAETGLARAEAGVRAARAMSSELGVMKTYSVIRAPFAGVVTHRFVDPGAFAAPGAPLVQVQDASELRLTANATPDAVRALRRGQSLDVTIEGQAMTARIEGVVPSQAGNLYTINALVPNAGRSMLSGSTATLRIPTGESHALLVPAAAVLRQGDLTGVTLRTTAGDQTRWVKLGAAYGTMQQVNAGLRAGDVVIVPTGAASAPAEK